MCSIEVALAVVRIRVVDILAEYFFVPFGLFEAFVQPGEDELLAPLRFAGSQTLHGLTEARLLVREFLVEGRQLLLGAGAGQPFRQDDDEQDRQRCEHDPFDLHA